MKLDLTPQDKKLANYLAEFPMICSAPFYFGNPSRPESKINNGTATLLKRDNRLFVVTNHHVLSAFYARQESEEGVTLQVGGLNVDAVTNRVLFDDDSADACVLDFSDYREADFNMFGDVPTEFYELGDIEHSDRRGKAVAFGGYPGAFRVQVATNEVHFHTFSSGASIVEDTTDRNIIVNINHNESLITSLTPAAPPAEIGGMSGGPVFVISSTNEIVTFRFAGIISECNQNLNVMFVKPVELFAHAFG